MTINAERVELLAAALESGEYQQGRQQLHMKDYEAGDRYCCLGVACEVAVKNGLELNVREDSEGTRSYDGSITILPRAVAQWYGFARDNGGEDSPSPWENNDGWLYTNLSFEVEDTREVGQIDQAYVSSNGRVYATELNDQIHWTFPQIAALMRKLAKIKM